MIYENLLFIILHIKTVMQFPILTTERLILRCLEPNDAPALKTLRSNKSVNQFLDRPKSTTLRAAQRFIQNILFLINSQQSFYWGIALKENNLVIGTICYWNLNPNENQAEIGYELHPKFQGKGMMQEAVLKILEYGWNEMQLKTITAFTRFDNLKSIALLEKFNFQQIIDTKESQYKCYALKKR
jgi:[ribosomal protein S5]-alanine N-acetyltransferase